MTNTREITRELHRGDVVYIEIAPTVGSQQSGIRPAVVIQNDTGNKFSPTVIVAPMTSSQSKKPLPTHISVQPEAETGLSKPSIILFEQITTLDKSRILSKVGRFSDNMMEAINKALAISVGLLPIN